MRCTPWRTIAASADSPGVRLWSANTRSTACSTGAAERNDRSSGMARQRLPARCRRAGRRRAPSRRTCAARRPGSCRSTASRRRRRTACASPRAGRSPEKNSCARASMICHCSGLVSCASSTRMWSRPPSSLNSTQAADRASRSSDAVLAIRSSKSSAARRALACAVALHHVAGQSVQRDRHVHGQQALALVQQRHEALLRLGRQGIEIGTGILDRLAEQARPRLALRGAEEVLERLDARERRSARASAAAILSAPLRSLVPPPLSSSRSDRSSMSDMLWLSCVVSVASSTSSRTPKARR